MCHGRWIRFPEFEELNHRSDCSYIAAMDIHEALLQDGEPALVATE